MKFFGNFDVGKMGLTTLLYTFMGQMYVKNYPPQIINRH